MNGRGISQRQAALLCLGVAVAVSSVLILRLALHLSFVYDDWDILVNRRAWSIGSFMEPYHEHIVLGPAVAFKGLAALFGINSATPFHLVAIAVFAASAVVLFFWLRARVGDWGALIGAFAILFLGASFENLLWAFQIGYFGCIALGLGMLIALDREDGKGDRWACVLLSLAVAVSSLGFAFLAGAAADVLLGRRPRRERLFIVAVPVALYVLWYVGWGHNAESAASLSHLPDVPKYLFDAASAGIVGLLGIATGDGSEPDRPHLIIGQVLLVGLLGLAGWRISRLGRVPRSLVVVTVVALAFWGLAALNETGDRAPESSRYLYPSGVFILLIAAELLRGVRISAAAYGVGAVVAVASAFAGMALMTDQYNARWITSSDYQRATLASVYIAQDRIDPDYPIVFGATLTVPASDYLAAVGDRGSPGFSDAELADQPEVYRETADTTLAMALGLAITAGDAPLTDAGCEVASEDGPVDLEPGAVTVENTGTLQGAIALGRFSDGFPSSFGELPPGSVSRLDIPLDRSDRPWRLGVTGATTFAVCPAPPAA